MSTLSVRLPDSLHNELRKLSKKDHISINQFITTALSEKITALETELYLKKRAEKGNRIDYLEVLKKVQNNEPEEYDK